MRCRREMNDHTARMIAAEAPERMQMRDVTERNIIVTVRLFTASGNPVYDEAANQTA